MSENTNAATVLKPNQWLDSSSKLTFFKDYRGVYVSEVSSLGNPAVKKLMAKNFEFMSRNLFFISAFGRFLLDKNQEQKVVEAETIARNTIENGIKAIQKRIAQAEVSLAAAQINEHTSFGREFQIEVPLTTPGAAKYSELIRKADYFYSLNSLLWIRGVIDDVNKFKNESDVRRDIMSVVSGILNQFRYILKLTNARDKAEAAKAGVINASQEAHAIKAIEELGQGGMLASVDGKTDTEAVGVKTDQDEATPGKNKRRTVKAAPEAAAATA